jgi:uncharacterized protein YciI
LSESIDYLKSQLEAGRMLLAGPCLDGAFGIVILTAEDESDARAFTENDPAIQNGVMSGELHPFKVSLVADDW